MSRSCDMLLMIELFRTNDAVLISYAEVLLRDAKIMFFVADQHMSIFEGSLGVLPRRMMIDANEEIRARRLMRDAGLEDQLK